MENSIKINEIEVTKINLQPGQILMASVYSDDISQADLSTLRIKLQTLFPDNKVILFGLPVDGKIEMSVIDTGVKENSGNRPGPVAHCNNCTLPVERIEGEKT
jgi:hypothetical protein